MKVLLLMKSTHDAPTLARAALVRQVTHRLRRSGELIDGDVLGAPPHSSPFVAAFWLVDCHDLARALEIAAGIPCHAVEVRPVMRPPGEEM